ncbi:MAG: hypothetical protein PWQ22_1175 [Archaeoglobaceae archaeon]|nr:hypothetical protein [Archaeoglobaceae archaeon]MDK2876765.1 hypothetical protein [Archaeoglobaceae archaeon]
MAEKKAPGLPLGARVVFGVLLVVEVLIVLFALEALHLATWPAFVAMILFFVTHENRGEISKIILGGAFGIINFFLCMLFTSKIAHYFISFGKDLATLLPVMIYVAVFVFLIVVLSETIPWLFNSYAFMYFSVAFADLASFMANSGIWIYWLATELVAGTILIYGVLGILKLVASRVAKKAPQ